MVEIYVIDEMVVRLYLFAKIMVYFIIIIIKVMFMVYFIIIITIKFYFIVIIIIIMVKVYFISPFLPSSFIIVNTLLVLYLSLLSLIIFEIL